MKLTTKGIVRLCVLAAAFALCALSAAAADRPPAAEALLEQFERKPSAETANRFMDALLKEEVLDEPVRFSARTPLDSVRQQVYYWGGEWLYLQQRYEDARRLTLKALPLFSPGNGARADCLNLLSIIHVRLSDFSTAARYARQCLEMDMKSGDDDLISSSMNTVASIYLAGNQPAEAEKYILKAIEHSGRADNPPRRAIILGTASEIYHKMGDDRAALAYAEQAYSIDSLLNREPQASIRLSQKGYALIGLQRYGEAEGIFRMVLPTLKSAGDRHSVGIVLNNLGKTLLRQGRPREAIESYREAAGIFSDMGDLYNEIHSHRGLYESYWEINPDSAKIELDRFNLLKDSLYSNSTAEALSRYNAEFGNDLLQKENDEIRLAQRRTLIAGAGLLLLVVAAAWLLIRILRRRHQRRMQRLMAEIERLRADAADSEPAAEAASEPSAEVSSQEEPDDEAKQFLKRVIAAVNAGMDSGSVSVAQIASELHLTEQSFRRRLQGAAGETPKAFFTAIRMERASSLLAGHPEMPISKVAELCGFDNVSSFGHAFKRMYDCSPSQYRDSSLAR